jgi:DNA-directed RNA polymerase subunit alpha
MAKKKNEEKLEQELFIDIEENLISNSYSQSAKLVNGKITRKIIIQNQEEEITISPLEPGFGHSIGHAFRRTILSDLTGYAISAVKIVGCTHKFQNLSGVRENVSDILMNLKEVVIKGTDKKIPGFFATIDVDGPGDITAKDIKMESGEIINPDHFICSLDVNGSFSAKLFICYGRGYVSSDEHYFQNTTSEEDKFLESAEKIDATYNHIIRINYNVEPTRVEDKTNYDKLIFHIKTTGGITPLEALGTAYGFIKDQMKVFEGLTTANIDLPEQEEENENYNIPDLMFVHISKVGLPHRVQNTLTLNGIHLVGDLVVCTKEELMKLPRMGNESLTDIIQTLNASGLQLPMSINGWNSKSSKLKREIIIKNHYSNQEITQKNNKDVDFDILGV